jgi:nicotinate-nucleotide adenylyltransferase
MRIGIFGGTFNPIHCGHLRSAEDVREAFALDRVYFVPAARPPHKSGEEIAPIAHRLRMVELAVAENPFFAASSIELARAGPSYSVDTIRYFLSAFHPSALAFIVGIDAFRELHTWKAYETIPALCDVIVTSRPGEENPALEDFLPVALKDAFWYDSLAHMFRHVSGHFFTLHSINGLSIASSTIRAMIHQRRSIRYLLPSAIETYIRGHRLYQAEEVIR